MSNLSLAEPPSTEESLAQETIELSIVMPCLNEAQTIGACVRKAMKFLRDNEIDGEVVIGDNGSTDESRDIARRNGARVVNVSARGYGSAIHGATQNCRGSFIIVGDADDSYDFSNLMPFIDRLRQGDDLVMGNRFRGGVRDGAMPWKNRYIGNPILSAIGRLFFSCPAKDFHCGLRGYSGAAFRRMDLQTAGMEFASEMVIKATLLKMKISEVPTTLDPDGRSRPPHLRPWRDGWRHLRFMLLYSPRWLFLYPGLFLMIFGFIGMTRLIRGPLQIGPVELDIDSLAFLSAAVLLGYQAMTFAMLSKVFAINAGLRPPEPRFHQLFNYLTMEVGLAIGALVFVIGLLLGASALAYWGVKGFGHLDPHLAMRVVIPSVLFLMLGCQTILSSFFLSVLGLRTRRLP
jgi:glycosyltransferase involved in cell wall biosynthesis